MSKATLLNIAFSVFFALLLFVPAGTAAWPQAWVYLAIFYGCSLAIGVWLRKTNPALLAERMRSPIGGDQKFADKLVMAAIELVFCAWLVFMALDARRFGWSHTPRWAQAIGAAMIVVAFYGWVLVLRANSFASVTVRVQAERGQTVISTGPYAIVRHPMYGYAILMMIGTPLLLGSLWGLVFLVVIMPLLATRTLREEAMLLDGLPGYRDYAAKVRYRLVPGVW